MARNLFITGQRHIGKTSLLIRVTQPWKKVLGGFSVQRLTWQGRTWAFRLLDLSVEEYRAELETKDEYRDILIYGQGPGKWVADLDLFRTKGVQALSNARDKKIVVMDELGVFEEPVTEFIEQIFAALSGPRPVLGVIKDKQSAFLEGVRGLQNVEALPMGLNNQDAVERTVREFLVQEVGGHAMDR